MPSEGEHLSHLLPRIVMKTPFEKPDLVDKLAAVGAESQLRQLTICAALGTFLSVMVSSCELGWLGQPFRSTTQSLRTCLLPGTSGTPICLQLTAAAWKLTGSALGLLTLTPTPYPSPAVFRCLCRYCRPAYLLGPHESTTPVGWAALRLLAL